LHDFWGRIREGAKNALDMVIAEFEKSKKNASDRDATDCRFGAITKNAGTRSKDYEPVGTGGLRDLVRKGVPISGYLGKN